MPAQHLTTEEYKELLNKEGLVLIDFYAEWCPPCKMMSPIIDNLADDAEMQKITFVKIDVDKDPAPAGEFQVSSIPTFVLLKTSGDGKYEIVEKFTGGQDPLTFKSTLQKHIS